MVQEAINQSNSHNRISKNSLKSEMALYLFACPLAIALYRRHYSPIDLIVYFILD
ncbi:hypothetical protein APA_260 [Pseudanabaena sp. lw0831]|nr:hypothetical protein APA_260 [Pseudanabaena sp. lw0831]